MKRIERTPSQIDANDIDMNLYRLQMTAVRNMRIDRMHRDKWQILVAAIRNTRPATRALMHDKDREDTI